jgi:hypothetical protein
VCARPARLRLSQTFIPLLAMGRTRTFFPILLLVLTRPSPGPSTRSVPRVGCLPWPNTCLTCASTAAALAYDVDPRTVSCVLITQPCPDGERSFSFFFFFFINLFLILFVLDFIILREIFFFFEISEGPFIFRVGFFGAFLSRVFWR